MEIEMDGDKTYLTLQLSNEQRFQNLARLVAVSDVLKRLGRVLSADIEQDLLTAPATVCQLGSTFYTQGIPFTINLPIPTP